jgi:hypothetical protein
MERVAIIARLKEGSEQRAEISPSEAVFVFEGHEVEWIVDDLIDEPFHYELQRALDQWREIVEGQPRVAREWYGWQLEETDPAATPARERSESWA